MTQIRLVRPPEIRLVATPPEIATGRRPVPFFYALVGVALLLTVANGVGLAYMAATLARMSNFSDELAGAAGFEKRISERLENFNDGMHAQFDKLSAHLDESRSEPGATSPRQARLPATLEAAAGTTGLGRAAMGDRQNGLAVDRVAPGKFRTVTRTAGFVRTQTPDGKVFYSAIR